jgi:hypothetical protein
MVQGTILLFVAAGEFVTTYRVRRVARQEVAAPDEAVAV